MAAVTNGTPLFAGTQGKNQRAAGYLISAYRELSLDKLQSREAVIIKLLFEDICGQDFSIAVRRVLHSPVDNKLECTM